jgi:hypothetical protein
MYGSSDSIFFRSNPHYTNGLSNSVQVVSECTHAVKARSWMVVQRAAGLIMAEIRETTKV